MKKTDNIIKVALTVLFAITVYIFWSIPYRAALSYQEQFQLFLTTHDYFLQHLWWPGGVVTYVAEFIVQFFNNYWIGAAIVAVAVTAIQLLTYRLIRKAVKGQGLTAYALSFIPSLVIWMYMGNINYMPTFVASAIIAMSAALWFCNLNTKIARLLFTLLALPAVYWIIGASVYVLVALMIADVCIRKSKLLIKCIFSIFIVIYAVILIFVGASFVAYPLNQILIGINYFRLMGQMPTMQLIVWMAIVATIVALWCIGDRKAMSNTLIGWITLAVVTGAGIFGIGASFDKRVYQLADYDYLLRINDWDGIIRKAEQYNPDTQLTVFMTNLALAMNGQLTTRAFEFFQNGPEGLFPAFDKDANSSMAIGEAYFQLGLINTAQRFAFEAMESNPTFNKSSRCLKRLVETNMIRGDYAVAEKYLKLLDKTLMYRKWAQRMRQLISTPGAIDQHPLYGKLRKRQLDDSFLFSELEVDKIMGQLVMHDPENTLATQYLLMYPLMQRDLDKFMQYMEVVQKATPYYRPVICQQGVAMAFVNAGQDIPHGLIDPPIMQQFTEFAQTMTTQGKNSQQLDRFKNTLWYYLIKE